MEKRLLNISGMYGLAALVSGVVFREFTKAMHFTGFTPIVLAHVHLMVLGAMVFLILSLYSKTSTFYKEKEFKPFMIFYNLGLSGMVVMFYVRGVNQVLDNSLSAGANAAMAGVSGVFHILLAAGLVYLYLMIRKSLTEN